MEALWNLEDKCKLSTQEAVLLLGCTALAIIVLCSATILIKRKAQRKQVTDQLDRHSEKWCRPSCGWVPIVMELTSSVRWSKAKKWRGQHFGGWEGRQSPLLGGRRGHRREVGWQSHNSASPVWQRPILMGEKCELPRFSGLILYDERGRPLDHSLMKEESHKGNTNQEKAAAVVRTTLRDLL